jgi:hypothetical protein
MDRPLVTIISPVYQQERYVARCIESALAQTYPHWEQVFVDDGSTDRTRDIIASFGDPRIRLLALPHRGLPALAESYNAALAASNGTLVGILEGDDLWPAHKLEQQVPLFDDPATVLSWGRGMLVDDTGAEVGTLVTQRARGETSALTTRDAFLRLTRTNFLIPSVSVMVRRSALDAIGGFQQGGSDLFIDLATWLWITAMVEGRVVFGNVVLGLYRVHGAQTSQTRRAEMTREHWRVVQGVQDALPASALARVRWDDAARRRARSRGLLADGELALSTNERAGARRCFLSALALGAAPGDRLLALLGLASAATGVNFVSRAMSLRQRLRA